jgi:hypothetical protein
VNPGGLKFTCTTGNHHLNPKSKTTDFVGVTRNIDYHDSTYIISLDKQKQPPYTSTHRKQSLIKKQAWVSRNGRISLTKVMKKNVKKEEGPMSGNKKISRRALLKAATVAGIGGMTLGLSKVGVAAPPQRETRCSDQIHEKNLGC